MNRHKEFLAITAGVGFLITSVVILVLYKRLEEEPTGKTSVLIASKESYDFGKVRILSSQLAKFDITNSSRTQEIIVRNVRSGCGCTVAKLRTHRLKPGASTELSVVFRSPDDPQDVEKFVVVEYETVNDHAHGSLLLAIRANVLACFDVSPRIIYFYHGGSDDASRQNTRHIEIKSANLSRADRIEKIELNISSEAFHARWLEEQEDVQKSVIEVVFDEGKFLSGSDNPSLKLALKDDSCPVVDIPIIVMKSRRSEVPLAKSEVDITVPSFFKDKR